MKNCGLRIDGNARAGCQCEGCVRIRRRRKEQMRAYRAQRNRKRREVAVHPEEKALMEVYELVR